MTVAEHNGDAPFYLHVVGWLDKPDREPDWPSG